MPIYEKRNTEQRHQSSASTFESPGTHTAPLARITDNRPEASLQMVVQRMVNARMSQAVGSASAEPIQRKVIQMVRYVRTSTGAIKEVGDDYTLGRGELEAGGPAPAEPAPAAAVAPRQAPPEPEAEPVELTPEERGYPLGFDSMEQFREVTRPIARANRDAQIVVTGSSVTGRSGDGTRAFREKDTPHVEGNKKSGPSDIDLGIVRDGSVGTGQVAGNGFPKKKSKLAKLERTYGRSVEEATGHPSGIKFFNSMPTERKEERGRSPARERRRIVRDHTPEGERRDDQERRGRGKQKGRRRGRGRGRGRYK